jgi:amidase
VNLAEYSAHDGLALAQLVQAGEMSARELAGMALAGAAAVNEPVNAVVGVYDDAVERAPTDAGGQFAGVPTMVKDLFHGDAERECGNGSRLSEGWVAPTDSEMMRRLRAAGFVSVGRTTTSEFGCLGTTETLACGATCTPWSAGHIAGGSSGGAAAVVGAGVVPVAVASDGGGSIRIPASCCGVVGLKPTRGRVTWGPATGEPLLGWGVHHVITRSVRDTAAALDALSGAYPGDPSTAPPPPRTFLDEVGAEPGRLRIAFCHEPWSGTTPDPQVQAACEATASLLAGLGHEVEAGAPPFDWDAFMITMADVWSATTAHLIDGFARLVGREPGPDTLEASTVAMLDRGRSVTTAELLAAVDHVNVLSRQLGAFFAGVDVLLTPTLASLPERLGVYDPSEEIAPRDLFQTWSRLETFLPCFNASGQPAISLPLHTSDEGLPIGMQLVGRFGDEATLLRLSGQLEEALPWAARVPPLHVSRA